ncbi:hypothetical protein [Haloplanus salilacus]|uniref:hypothetical protein n=1 Tax=Haloplanus salilacus TaxID=2949994 RepID=UPI0030CE87F9
MIARRPAAGVEDVDPTLAVRVGGYGIRVEDEEAVGPLGRPERRGRAVGPETPPRAPMQEDFGIREGADRSARRLEEVGGGRPHGHVERAMLGDVAVDETTGAE